MNKKIKLILSGIVIGACFFTGCSMDKSNILPKEIVANAMETDDKSNSYYGEAKVSIFEDNKLVEESTIKEWVNLNGEKNKRRSETIDKDNKKTITTNDGKNIVIYMEKQNKALTAKALELKENVGTSQREQAMDMLKTIKDSHEISNLGEEEVNGVKTYHLKATPKEKDNILGEMEIWVDKKNWFMMKTISRGGNSKIQLEYTKVDFSPKFDENIFTQDIPSGVEVEDLDKTINENKKKISLEEARKFVEKPILYIEESSGYKMQDITLQMYKSKVIEDEIIQDYYKDGKKVFTLSFRKEQKLEKNKKDEKDENIKLPGEKEINIRGQKGMLFDDTMKLISWSENGVSYSLMIESPNLTIEDAKKLIENMKLMK